MKNLLPINLVIQSFSYFIFLSTFYSVAQSRIVGGEDVEISSYPWQVAVAYEGPDFGSMCGGSIIGDSWVLTAAHCVDGAGDASTYTINAGSSDNWSYSGESYDVVQIISHPDYDDQWLHNDIALIQIEGSFNFSENIAPISLISASDVLNGLQDPGVLATSTGWGVSTSAYLNDTIEATQLQMIEVPIVSNEVACGAATDPNGFAGEYGCLLGLELELYDGTTIYAGDLENGGLSAASGDSGGPLVVPNADSTDWLLVGVTSGGYTPGMPQYPMGYTTVSFYLEWIFHNAEVTSDYGCMDETACNFDAEALFDHGFCYTTNECGACEPAPLFGFDCYGECLSGEKIHVEVEDVVSASPAQWQLGDYEGIRGSYDVCLEEGCHTFYIIKDGAGPWLGYNYTISQEDSILAQMYLDQGQGGSLLINVNSECAPIYGCYDTLALNYDALVNSYDASCIYPIQGCTDVSAYNFDSLAVLSDGSCFYDTDCIGATLLSVNVNAAYTEYLTQSISWEFEGFEGNAGEEKLICVQPGCHTFTMSTFTGPGWLGDVTATITTVDGEQLLYATLDDGFNGTIEVDVASDCDFVYGCTNPIAFNYNVLANQDDGFCHLPILDCGDSTTAFMQFTGGDYNYLISWEMNGIEGDSYPFDLQQGQFCLADGCYIYNMYSDTSQAPSWLDSSQLGWGGAEVTILASGGQLLGLGTLENTNVGSLTFSLNQDSCSFTSGCTDSLALNYIILATAEDGSCIYPILGCTDSLVLNFSPEANTDDGSCSKVECEGLTRLQVEITGDYIDDVAWSMSGFYGEAGASPVCLQDGCHAFNINTFDENGIQTDNWFDVDVQITNTAHEVLFYESINENNAGIYNFALNTLDSCIAGCTNPLAFNYEANANANDGSCIVPIECEFGTPYVLMMTDSWPYGEHTNELSISQSNGDVLSYLFLGSLSQASASFCLNDGCNVFTVGGQWANEITWDLIDANQNTVISGDGNQTGFYSLNYSGECGPIFGCTDSLALNYDSNANASNNSCNYPVSGCTDSLAINFNPDAVSDNGTCQEAINCSSSNIVFVQLSQGEFPSEVTWSVNEYSGTVGFSQICLASGCHTFTMIDSYGDGWNGAVVTISDAQNNEIISGTLSSGLQATLEVCIDFTIVEILGCTDTTALNFNPTATQDDNSCEYPQQITNQLIELPSGWSLFSSYIQSNPTDLMDIFNPFSADVIIVKNNTGDTYLPEFNFNNIGDLQSEQGYYIKTYNAFNITLEGVYVTPELNPIALDAGWNLIGYLRLEPADASAVLADISASGNLIIAKDYAGNTYLPEFNFNGIGDFVPGQGYQLKINNDAVLNYLSNEDSYRISSVDITKNSSSYFKKTSITDNNMVIVMPDACWDTLPKEGAEITAYDSFGTRVGSVKYTSPVTVLTVWGDDALTAKKDGLDVTEVSSFKIVSNHQESIVEVTDWMQGSSFYATNQINVASSIVTNAGSAPLISGARVLVKVINVLGQVVIDGESCKGKVLFHVYNDGTVEKRVQ
ncbi:serine protease [Flavobacteriales bacterium]|nr:serine protease [Flavobacteriales bacterium]